MQAYRRLKRITGIALLLTMVINLLMPLTAYAREPEQKVLRVGWYESPFYFFR